MDPLRRSLAMIFETPFHQVLHNGNANNANHKIVVQVLCRFFDLGNMVIYVRTKEEVQAKTSQ